MAEVAAEFYSTEELLILWNSTRELLAPLVEKELRYRKEIARRLNSKFEGSETTKLAGFKITVVNKVNRTLDEETLNALLEEYPQWLDKLVDFKPAMSLSEYRKLDDDERNVFDECVTAKPGTPSVTVVPVPAE